MTLITAVGREENGKRMYFLVVRQFTHLLEKGIRRGRSGRLLSNIAPGMIGNAKSHGKLRPPFRKWRKAFSSECNLSL